MMVARSSGWMERAIDSVWESRELRALAHELIHKRARSRKITGDLDAIHDYDSLDLRLR